jgi:hypothetical protein
LLNGPVIQNDLFSLLVRFLKYKIVFIADLIKMYRQVLIHPDQQDLQRIIWSKDGKLQTFRLKTITYGTKSASFLATRTLHELANIEKSKYPVAADTITRDFYMDDLISGANTKEEALQIKNEIQKILESGGFILHKWATNDETLLNTNHQQADQITIKTENSVKTLGLLCCPKEDVFKYKINVSNKTPITKRDVLSEIAQIFDPLGKLAPIIIKAKVFLQELWLHSLDWSEILPQAQHQSWERFRKELNELSVLNIQRCLFPSFYVPGSGQIEIHAFSDASERAYGTAIYLKYTLGKETSVQLICAKSKVAPLSKQTLPRLELVAAELAAKLLQKVLKALQLQNVNTFLWTDSTIVLEWIRTPPNSLKTFVGNRVANI